MTDLYRDNTTIDISDKFLGDSGLSELCSKFSEVTALKTIVLRGNCITEKGVQPLCTLLSHNLDIEYLSLEWNQLGSSGLISLSQAFCNMKKLKSIDLKNNEIGDEGAMSLVDITEECPNIKILDLRWNQISDRGVESFKNLIVSRKGNLTVLFTGNPISVSLSSQIEDWGSFEDKSGGQEIEAADNLKKDMNFDDIDKNMIHEELKTLESENKSLLRQLDSSAIRVTDLEQMLHREQFKSAKYSEEANLHLHRVSELNDEIRRQSDKWEDEIMKESNSHKMIVSGLEEEIKNLSKEKEKLKFKLKEAEAEKNKALEHAQRVITQAENSQNEMMNEISILTSKISESSLSETRAKSELYSTTAALQRSNAKIEKLDSELGNLKAEYQSMSITLSGKTLEEINRITSEFTLREKNDKEEIIKLSSELNNLNIKLNEASMKIALFDIELKKETDLASSNAKQIEKENWQKVTDELKNRIETFMLTRKELEDRCKQYNIEVNAIKEENKIFVSDLTSQNKSLQEELQELRLKYNEQKKKSVEYNELKKNRNEMDKKIEILSKLLEEANSERKTFLEKINEQDKQISELNSHRNTDFNNFSHRISEVLRNEIQTIRSSVYSSTN